MKQFECVQIDTSERWDKRELPRQFAKGAKRKENQRQGQIKTVMGFLQPKVVPSGQQLGLTATGAHWTAQAATWNNETAHLCPAGVARGE